ncbi:MAG: hypothetical protein IAI49_04130 [Candidatus Eremiobacteraeota bacterium]|nr:hypothetical protein [Candidatus Eremiobacteraeota bacterium]
MRSIVSILIITVAAAGPAVADGPPFTGPASWSSNGSPVSADPAHPVMQWHLPGDTASSLTYARTTAAYADSLAAIHTNFTTNKIKPAVDKDVQCQGKTAHVVEFATGPDEHKIVINRMLVPTSDGVATLTYSRADGTSFDPDVQKAETTFCAAS